MRGGVHLNRSYKYRYNTESIVFQKDNYAVVATQGQSIPCSYSIEGDTITIHSTPNWDRAYGKFSMTLKIKNKMEIISEDGKSFEIDNLQLIYIYQAIGISGIIFIASGISAIKKRNKNKQIKASE